MKYVKDLHIIFYHFLFLDFRQNALIWLKSKHNFHRSVYVRLKKMVNDTKLAYTIDIANFK